MTIRRLMVVIALGLAVLAATAPAHADTTTGSVASSDPASTTVGVATAAIDRTTTLATDQVATTDGARDSNARRDAGAPPAADDRSQGMLALEQWLRAVFAAAALSAIGVLVFVRTVWDGSGRELALLSRLIERASLVAAFVVLAQVATRAALTAGGWSDAPQAWPTLFGQPYGIGMALRAGGAVLLSAGAENLRQAPRSTLPATVGAGLIVGSFALAGYAAGAEPRLVSMLALVAHVAAAAAWGGGLLALAVTLAHRKRAGTPLRAGYVAARFSVIATCAVALAAAAGVALAVVRLDAVSALWASTYGLILMAKVALVASVAGIGAYNHFVVVPVLRVEPDHTIGRRLHWLGSAEVALFVAVISVNSWLVGLAG